MKIAITGANSSVGRCLLDHVSEDESIVAVAGVRSSSAFGGLPKGDRIQPAVINYADRAGLAAAFEGADVVIHLAGILIETRQTNYQEANVAATEAVVQAAGDAGVGQVVFVSVIGADATSSNAYFRSKGQAEQCVLKSGSISCAIRTPLLLGPGTAGASAILWAASRDQTRLLGGGEYTMHPLDVDDLCRAILHRCRQAQPESGVYELAGPEPILYRDLIRRVAELQGRTIRIGNLPVWLAKLGAAIKSRLQGGMSPAVIDVITMNETLQKNDYGPLGITLTPLDETLQKILIRESSRP